ncbi:MAG TPA: 4'-phosphopantetheinyl transferase superfamily protein [Dyella sp.]|uniref:4'-phosphopantetheinyl transferase family protein n=1 Tax=Dyella sp. TaxID=1869338 RepID=UPI002C61042B|nr:4'-phosphopantetheinyl transferase superfamily protein [Dyella sp.]HUB89270.1 4'-phosphopantetheinyl transferase superfamily protein [Dyella sp.]
MTWSPDAALPLYRILLDHRQVQLPPAFALPFDVAAHDDAAFAQHGIACPASIARSVRKRQAEFLAGRLAARAALAACGAPDAELAIGSARQPVWPRGYLGSISHTGNLAVAIALPSSQLRGIGIDLEHVVSPATLHALRTTVVDDDERKRLTEAALVQGWPVVLTAVFSAKESFFKASFATVGRLFDFHAVRVLRFDTDNGDIEVEVVERLAEPFMPATRWTLRYQRLNTQTLLTHMAW